MGEIRNLYVDKQIIRKLLFLVFLVSIVFWEVNSVKLDSDGYYDIVVAINEKTAQDENEDYIAHLKVGIQDLGDALFESTHAKFAIRSADIVVPDHWDVDEDTFVTTQTYKNADIRVSHEYLVPQAVNPLFCSYPGQFIELPYSIFDERDTSVYGPTGKALLTLWARYRFGVHEEHGFPGDSQFPYYWKEYRLPGEPGSKIEGWRVTNCHNKRVTGKYETVNEDEDEKQCRPHTDDGGIKEDEGNIYPPSSDCRFIPDTFGQESTTSLMSYTFIQNLLDFCDKDTHNPRAPTRQNHFCQYKSIWEIIRESPDWKVLDHEEETVRTRVNFRIVKKKDKPLLFILTDGVNRAPQEVISGVSTGLREIFNGTDNWNVLTGLGVFPGDDWKDSFDMAYQWNLPYYDAAEGLVASFESSFGTKTGFRNFGAAIQDIGNQIKDREHENGAVILVMKFGSEAPDFQAFFQASEGEVLGTILSQNIKVFAIEGKDSQGYTGYRLKNLADLSVGKHFAIGDDEAENMDLVADAMEEIYKALEDIKIPQTNRHVVHKELIKTDSRIPGPIPIHIIHKNVKSLKFYFHQIHSFLQTEIIPPPIITDGPEKPTFNEYNNWDKEDMLFKSYVAQVDTSLTQSTEWAYEISCFNHPCVFLMIVIAELDESESPLPGHDISLSISTSAEADDSIVDLSVESVASLKGTAFSIYAKLEKDGHPISSPDLQVEARIQVFSYDKDELEYFGLFGYHVTLYDDGLGAPDMTANDGIFSGNLIPGPSFMNPQVFNGAIQIFVKATLNPPPPPLTTNATKELEMEYKLPIRCGSGWQGCWNEVVAEPFFIYSELQRRLEFRGVVEYNDGGKHLGAVSRIIDFRLEPNDNANTYDFVWTHPYIQLFDGGRGKAGPYRVCYTEDVYQILNPDTDFNLIPKVPDSIVPIPPDTTGTEARFSYTIEKGKRYYFAIKAFTLNPQVGAIWSNVIFLETSEDYEFPTTSTTTSTPPPSTPTTTRKPTPPRTTTLPGLTSTTTTTTESTTWGTRPTTPTTTTRTTTTPSTTTIRFEGTTVKINHWYKSTAAIIAFSVFGAALLALIGGGLIYYKFFK